MRKIILFTIFVLCTMFASAKDVTVVATGTSSDIDFALNIALCNAFDKQFGKYIEGGSKGTITKQNLWGNIEKVKSYKIISITESKDKYGAPQVTAKIEVIFDMDKTVNHNEKQFKSVK